jgi:hypothetical protein
VDLHAIICIVIASTILVQVQISNEVEINEVTVNSFKFGYIQLNCVKLSSFKLSSIKLGSRTSNKWLTNGK